MSEEVPAKGADSWSAGIINHGSFDDLERCLASIAAQTRPARDVAVWDTGVDREAILALSKRHPGVHFAGGSNQGYAGGANRVVGALTGSSDDSVDHVLVLNPDVELEPSFAERMLEAMAKRTDVAIAGGKLLRSDRRTIDSAGITFPRHGRPRDRGSETLDRGQFESLERVEGVSGAAMWIRASVLDAIAVEGELFDEDFFAYHEDTDLCWRARRLGYGILYVPDAVAIHSRGWQRARRAAIPVAIRRHSFKNHYLQLAKNETARGFVIHAPWLITWEILRLGFVLLRDRELLPAYGEALRALPRALRRRAIIGRRARESQGRSPADIGVARET